MINHSDSGGYFSLKHRGNKSPQLMTQPQAGSPTPQQQQRETASLLRTHHPQQLNSSHSHMLSEGEMQTRLEEQPEAASHTPCSLQHSCLNHQALLFQDCTENRPSLFDMAHSASKPADHCPRCQLETTLPSPFGIN